MKKLIVVLLIGMLYSSVPEIVPEVKAQERTVAERKQDRRQRRRVKRRVRRRVTRRAHVAYRHLPRYRAVVKIKPAGAVVIKRGGVAYHYHEGVYYQPKGTTWVVARPAVGIRVASLPVARRRVVVKKRTYFYYYGNFYNEIDGQYEVVEAPVGALVDAIPDGYEVEEVDGQEYYVLDDVYYQEVETDALDDGVGYEVVKIKS